MRGDQENSEIVQGLQIKKVEAFNDKSTAKSRVEEASMVEKSGRSDSNGVLNGWTSGVEEQLEW